MVIVSVSFLRVPNRVLFIVISTMANRTVDEAISVHGMNPQFLIEKILRTRIYESMYWKEHCFALNGK
jgi:hypothetical protein